MREHEYALEQEMLTTGEKHVILFWSRDLAEIEANFHRFVTLDEEHAQYTGGQRTKKYRVVERPVPEEPTIVWEETL